MRGCLLVCQTQTGIHICTLELRAGWVTTCILDYLWPSCKQEFHAVLCILMWQTWRNMRLPGVAVLGAGATSPGTVERSQAVPVGQWAFSGAKWARRAGPQSPSSAVHQWKEGFVLETDLKRLTCFLEFYMHTVHKNGTIAPECRGPGPSAIRAPDFELTGEKTSCQRSGSRWRHATQLHLEDSLLRPAEMAQNHGPPNNIMHLVNRMVVVWMPHWTFGKHTFCWYCLGLDGFFGLTNWGRWPKISWMGTPRFDAFVASSACTTGWMTELVALKHLLSHAVEHAKEADRPGFGFKEFPLVWGSARWKFALSTRHFSFSAHAHAHTRTHTHTHTPGLECACKKLPKPTTQSN